MKARQLRHVAGCRWRVTLQTENVYLAHAERPWIRGAVRSVATRATLLLYRNMLKDKRAHRFRVAIGADRELPCGGAQLSSHEAAVWIVAVAT